MKGIESQLLLQPDADPACAYKMPPEFEEILQTSLITETVGVLASEEEGVIQDSYNLCRRKANKCGHIHKYYWLCSERTFSTSGTNERHVTKNSRENTRQ